MALAGTKPTNTALTHSAEDQVTLGASSAPKPSLWQTLKPFGWPGLLLVGVLIALYAPVLKILVRQWYSDADYSHGFLVPLLSLYLIWQRREKLRQVARRPSAWGMLVVVLSVGLLFLGSLGAELFLTRISMLGHHLRADRIFLRRRSIARHGFSRRASYCLRFPYRF